MTIRPGIEPFVADAVGWRRDLHANPELMYDLPRTSQFVANLLRTFGCDEVVTSIGRTGVVGSIKGGVAGSDKVIGLRADMDALPIHEQTNLAYRSKIDGKMHACGHDGHTAMLLGAARYLAATRNFSGTLILIFQPAEEGGAGAKAMIDDGLMERFGIQEVYGLHNLPNLPVGAIAMRPGPIMAAADHFIIRIEGQGGHGAIPEMCRDPVLAGAAIVTALQSIVARAVRPIDSAVVSATRFQAGAAFNIIPQTAEIMGTTRSFTREVQDLIERRMEEIIRGTALSHGVTASLTYNRNYPSTINHPPQTAFAASVAKKLLGAENVETDAPPLLGAEDFSFMLQSRPGAYIFLGNGDSAGLHHPAYDFNDDALPIGMSYWTELAESALRA